MSLITLNDVKEDAQVKAFIKMANEHLGVMGFTEHGFRHAGLLAKVASTILKELDFPKRTCELAEIAAYLHDIGNVVARVNHWQSSATLASQILARMGMNFEEIGVVIGAIGNHDEHTGEAVNSVAAALIIADKADVHRGRVRNRDFATFDIHDRVNYAVERSSVKVEPAQRTITLYLEIDTEICPLMEYFEIFLTRMVMSRRAAEHLNCKFSLIINNTKLL
ncbi:MAG: HD domain-containing protein [Halanaerobiales bacterium]|nr:HD domain-containing protein [Halanaerobiales bacterium]